MQNTQIIRNSLLIFCLLFITKFGYSAIPDSTITIPLTIRYDSIQINNSVCFQNINNQDSLLRNYTLPNFGNIQVKFSKIRMYPFPNDTLFIYTGLSQNEDRLLCVDENLNHDFSDDSLYVYNASLDSLNHWTLSKPFFVYRDGENKKELVSFRVTPFEAFYEEATENETKTNYSIIINYKYSGHLNIGNKSYNIECYTRNLNRFKDGKELLSFANKSKQKTNDYDNIKDAKDGVLFFDSLEYHVKSVSPLRDSITLQFVRITIDSLSVNRIIANASYNRIGTDSIAYLHNTMRKYKYLLIDFWGPWCSPCVASIPELKNLYEKNKELGLGVLSVSTIREGYKKELLETIELIQKYNMNWEQGYNNVLKHNNKDKDSISKKLKIRVYPCYILIDNKGKIIIKANGMQSLAKEITPKIEELLN